jgi:2-methylisocitrate lyase-like PEP mutase family enzyme
LKRLGYREVDIANDGSDILIDALVAHGSVSSIIDRLKEHFQAGADHVAVQVLSSPADSPEHIRTLADALGISAG